MIYDVGAAFPTDASSKPWSLADLPRSVLTAEEAEQMNMDFDSFGKRGEFLGSGGVVILDDQTCMVKFALRVMKFYQHEAVAGVFPAVKAQTA